MPPITLFLAIDLILTLAFFTASSPIAHIGTLRPVDSILPKLGELAAVGIGLGVLATIAYRYIDLALVSLFAAFVILLDLDHLPSALGIVQPIRPAHSLAFLGITLVAMVLVFKSRQPEVGAVLVASVLGHLAADSGVFPIFAPFTFEYYSIDNALRIPLIAGAVAFALTAGYIKNKRISMESSIGSKNKKRVAIIRV